VTDIRAVLGEHDRDSKTEAMAVERKLTSVKVYANFSILTFNNDIAVLELESPVELGNTIRPTCLPSDGESSPVKECERKQICVQCKKKPSDYYMYRQVKRQKSCLPSTQFNCIYKNNRYTLQHIFNVDYL
jgi:hypothetical protein